jgi:hypothetical protein
MKAISEQKQILDDIDLLINKMESQIEMLRNINYRYYLMYGEKIQCGVVEVPDNIDFAIPIDQSFDALCRLTDYNKIGMENDYQKIKKEIQRLS